MDLRIEKTKKSIINAFIELRSRKPLEKITIKELCEKALINKSTFYSHYADIYDLSDQLESEVVNSVMQNLPNPENIFDAPAQFTKELFTSYLSQDALIQILFSGNRRSQLIFKIETELKNLVFGAHPEYEQDPVKNTLLSFCIYGGYHAFAENRHYGEELVVSVVAQMSAMSMEAVRDFF